jgi:transposase
MVKQTNVEKLIEQIHGKPLIDILRDKYVIEGLSCKNIGEQLGVSEMTILRWVKKYRLHFHKTAWNKGLNKEEMERVINLKK